MQAKKWNLTKDYSTISKWCKQHKWDLSIPKEMLPPLGVIISEKEKICAAGLYIDKKAKFGFMYGLFSNPKTSKLKLFKAMKLCLKEIENQAIKNKLGMVYTITGEPSLNKLYTKHMDMKLCENNVKSYVMNLNKKKYKNLDWIS
jgi:hypothetical protein|tara:strand:- start:2225 stop:2659 length:435 start_codon:yes stop_codon:yes gene_type:complete